MVLVSFSPLFFLLAIRGNKVIPEVFTWAVCLTLIILPLFLLVLRVSVVWRSEARETLQVGTVEDNQTHLLAYLFATMLPFYRSSLESWRDLAAIGVALAFIVFVFWYLRLHYINFLLAAFHYRVYTVYPPEVGVSKFGRHTAFVIITRRNFLPKNELIFARRLSDSVYWETSE